MSSRPFPVAPFRQRGASLLVVLVLLLVMTLLGVLSLRGTLMEERMAGGSLDRSVSFQAAEAALRAGEAQISGYTDPSSQFPASGCNSAGLCASPAANDADRWAGIDCQEGAPWQTVAIADSKAETPRYIIERMGPIPPPWNPGCGLGGDPCQMIDSYRITACSGDPANGRAITLLQTNYIKP